MAELILTEEEKKAHLFTQWDEGSIGRLVKKLAIDIHEFDHEDEKSVLTLQSAALLIISHSIRLSSKVTELKMEGVTLDNGKTTIGDWTVTVEKEQTPSINIPKACPKEILAIADGILAENEDIQYMLENPEGNTGDASDISDEQAEHIEDTKVDVIYPKAIELAKALKAATEGA